jgi:hypothetical protein
MIHSTLCRAAAILPSTINALRSSRERRAWAPDMERSLRADLHWAELTTVR